MKYLAYFSIMRIICCAVGISFIFGMEYDQSRPTQNELLWTSVNCVAAQQDSQDGLKCSPVFPNGQEGDGYNWFPESLAWQAGANWILNITS
jgi:hypothetical protein